MANWRPLCACFRSISLKPIHTCNRSGSAGDHMSPAAWFSWHQPENKQITVIYFILIPTTRKVVKQWNSLRMLLGNGSAYCAISEVRYVKFVSY